MVRARTVLMVWGVGLRNRGGSCLLVAMSNLLHPLLVRVGGGHGLMMDHPISQESN